MMETMLLLAVDEEEEEEDEEGEVLRSTLKRVDSASIDSRRGANSLLRAS